MTPSGLTTVVDYGVGNLGSIAKMLSKVGATARISSSPADILAADRLVLPGVGAFDSAMRLFNESGLRDVIEQRVLGDEVPLLAICLGMQMLTESSEEGRLPGLGWVSGAALAFRGRITPSNKVPYMGWNLVDPVRESPLTRGFAELGDPRFYFVHSYFVQAADPAESILRTRYDIEYDSGVQRNNIYGVQFHPEKSHRYGLKLFQNFVTL
jgi:imidazole glycerol-phosphate synthase subunit HisH